MMKVPAILTSHLTAGKKMKIKALTSCKIDSDGFGACHGFNGISDPLGSHSGIFNAQEGKIIGAPFRLVVDLNCSNFQMGGDLIGTVKVVGEDR